MKMLKQLLRIYNKAEELLLVTMILFSVAILFINVVLRKGFNSSVYGADELARVLFIWMSWLGISIGERESEHIKIDILTNKLHGKSQRAIHAISNLITVAILAVLLRYGMVVVSKYFSMGNRTPMYHIPQWFVYFCVPLSCGIMALRILIRFVDSLKPERQEGVEIS